MLTVATPLTTAAARNWFRGLGFPIPSSPAGATYKKPYFFYLFASLRFKGIVQIFEKNKMEPLVNEKFAVTYKFYRS